MEDDELRCYLDEIVRSLRKIEEKPTQYFIDYGTQLGMNDIKRELARDMKRGKSP